MKKIIHGVLLLSLVCFSFFYTDRVIYMINKKDPLMQEIVNIKSNYDILPVNAIIMDDTIIPGVNGREIDVDKSYESMKLSGIFIEDNLIFKDLIPSSSINNHKDKYIVKGNGSKKKVAILTIFNDNIDKINGIENINVFINHNDLNMKNLNKFKKVNIYTYGNNGKYSEEILTSDNTLINSLSNNKSLYCLVKEKNDDVINLCSKNNMYTVIPNIIGNYYDVRNYLSNGSIILLDNLNDIDNIIRYIKSKGYDIVTLSDLLSE